MGGPTGACNTTRIIASHTPSRMWAGAFRRSWPVGLSLLRWHRGPCRPFLGAVEGATFDGAALWTCGSAYGGVARLRWSIVYLGERMEEPGDVKESWGCVHDLHAG